MAQVNLPPTVKSLANSLTIFLTTPPAAPSGIPTLVEVNAGLAAQCFFYGPFNVTPEQSTGAGPRKDCTPSPPTKNGLVTYPAVEAHYSYNPQALGTPGAAGNELYEALEPYGEVTAVTIKGISGRTGTVPANSIGDVYLMDVGVRRKGETGDGEFDEFSVRQSLVVSGGEPVAQDHKFA